jgi:hypothetical protein
MKVLPGHNLPMRVSVWCILISVTSGLSADESAVAPLLKHQLLGPKQAAVEIQAFAEAHLPVIPPIRDRLPAKCDTYDVFSASGQGMICMSRAGGNQG